MLITFRQCCIPESGITPCGVGPGLGANSFFMLKEKWDWNIAVCEGHFALYALGLVP